MLPKDYNEFRPCAAQTIKNSAGNLPGKRPPGMRNNTTEIFYIPGFDLNRGCAPFPNKLKTLFAVRWIPTHVSKNRRSYIRHNLALLLNSRQTSMAGINERQPPPNMKISFTSLSTEIIIFMVNNEGTIK
jgi:hypothetical protein